MIVVPARKLDPPTIFYKGTKMVPSNGSWNMMGKKFYLPTQLRNWSILTLGRARITGSQLDQLRKQATDYGLGDQMPLSVGRYNAAIGISDDGQTDMAILDVLSRAKRDGIEYLFVILESSVKTIYARLKFHADVSVGEHATRILVINSTNQATHRNSCHCYGY